MCLTTKMRCSLSLSKDRKDTICMRWEKKNAVRTTIAFYCQACWIIIQRQSMCEMHAKMASRETVPVHRRSLDAIISVCAISVIGLCVWAECLKCLLPAISWLPFPHDSTDCLMSETVPMTWHSWSLRFFLLVYLATCVIPTYGHVPWLAAGGWPISVWAWSPPPVQSNGDGESHTKSEY